MLRTCIALALLVAPAVARGDEVKLANGDVLNGEIVEWAVDHLVLDHPQLGRIRLSLDRLATDTGKPPSPGLFGTRILRGWNRHVSLGAAGDQGDSESTNITAGIDFGYEDDFKRWRLTGRYLFDQTDGSVEDNNARIDLRRDWLTPESRFFWLAAARYQFDQTTDWRHRTVVFGGPGYHLVDRVEHRLDVALGPAFTREYQGENQNKAEALLGLDYRWKLGEWSTFEITNQFYVEVQPEAGEYRNLTIAKWRIKLTEEPALSLDLAADNEYEPFAAEGDDEIDLNYSVSLGLDF